jgi:hypothetical protein
MMRAKAESRWRTGGIKAQGLIREGGPKLLKRHPHIRIDLLRTTGRLRYNPSVGSNPRMPT